MLLQGGVPSGHPRVAQEMVGQSLASLVAGVTGLWGVFLKSLGATFGTGYQAVWVLVGWSTAKGLVR